MSQSRNPLSILLALIILGGLIAGTYFFLQWLFLALGAGEDSSLAMVVAVLFAMTLLIAGIRQAGQSQEVDPLRFEKKAKAYQQLIDAWALSVSDSSFSPNGNQSAALQGALQEVTLWGSSEVIRHLRPFSQKSTPINVQDPQERNQVENVLRAMRRDLGQSNLVLHHDDLLNLFVPSSSNSPMSSTRSSN